jgi:hypothetical protein
MDVTMLNGIALLNLFKNSPQPRPGDPTHEQLLEEVRFGNRYFLKMQDADGKIWADVAGGVNGDNSDNHWTDNIIGTADDRYLNPQKRSGTAAVFATLEALAGQCYAATDPAYARQCLGAAVRAWQAFTEPPTSTQDVGWWAMAASELFLASAASEYREHALLLGRDLLKRQNTEYLAGQKQVRGFWMEGDEKQSWWLGGNCHYAANALALGWLAQIRDDAGKRYVSLAYRQLEWIMGANPFGSCMMTGEGMRNPFPHSRFVGLIPGGIMNGIAGNVNDDPVLDLEYTLDWRTCEYWSPHVAFYIWANSVLEGIG